jgi:hypothetical protein
MNNEIAKALGEQSAEIIATFMIVIQIIKKQPSFNNDQFESDIKELLLKHDSHLSLIQKEVLSTLSGKSESQIES